MVVWRGKSKKQFRSNFIHRVALKKLVMMILIILDSKIIKMVIMAEWENLGATRKVHNATLLDLIISEISLLPSSPPCSLHIVTNLSNPRVPVGWYPATQDKGVIAIIPQNVNFAFVAIRQHLADSQSIFSLVFAAFAASSNVVFMKKIVSDVLFEENKQ
jgi:hypothetical protein